MVVPGEARSVRGRMVRKQQMRAIKAEREREAEAEEVAETKFK